MVFYIMIGKLRHKISVYSVTLGASNGFNAPIVTETLRFNTRAMIEEISRESSLRNGLEAETEQYKVTIRSANNTRTITKDDKVIWNGLNFKVRTSPKKVNLANKDYLEFIITAQHG